MPLHEAAYAGDVVRIRALIEEGADVNALNLRGDVPLLRALEYSKFEAAQALLDAGASLEGATGSRALQMVSARGELAWVKELLRRGVRADSANAERGTTALQYAAGRGEIEVMGELVRAGARVNTADHEGVTPLHEAARAGHLDACRWLLEAKADREALDHQGQSPLFEAIYASRPVEIHIYSGDGPHSTLFRPQTEAPLVKLFLDQGASLKVIDKEGYSPLHYAVLERSEPALRLLLQRGAARDVKNRDGETPLAMATRFKYGKLAALLKEP